MIAFLLRQKGRRIWRCRYRLDGETKIKETSLHTSDRRVADQRLRDLVSEQEQEAAGIISPKSLRIAALKPMSEHLEDYVKDLKAQGRSVKHIANIEYKVGVIINECDWKRPGSVTADSFVTWRGDQKLAAKTINDYLSAAASLLNWMKDKKRISVNPLDDVGTVKTAGCETRIRRAFTDDEIRRLLAIAGEYSSVYMMAGLYGIAPVRTRWIALERP